jgi:DNA (cytosine-5)-methyltransferase 1
MTIETLPLFDLDEPTAPDFPRIGSLFSGTGALDLGVRAALGGETAWVCDNAPTARAILAHHWPDIPNLGDIGAVHWPDVEPVDVLIGGFPCTDVSAAGRRTGLIRHTGRTRSGLWFHMAEAIQTLRPSLVVIENVKGLLNAPTDFDPAVLACPSCVDATGSPSLGLRALGAVLGDLADIGYDAAWRVVAAGQKSDGLVPHVGCCHQRERIFILAWPATDTGVAGLAQWGEQSARSADGGHLGGAGPAAERGRADPPGGVAALLPTPERSDSTGGRVASELGGVRPSGSKRAITLGTAVALLPTPDAKISASGPDYARMNRTRSGGHDLVTAMAIEYPHDAPAQDWGKYAAAVHRWEAVTRPAPPPTTVGPRGAYRLSPDFTEWMMGLPAGWVTDVPLPMDNGPVRRQQLKALGDAVVRQQVTLAVRGLLADVQMALTGKADRR